MRPSEISLSEIRLRAIPLLAAFLVLLYACWLVSGGTWNLVAPEAISGFYDAQARALLDGRWDVECHIISSEALRVGDKCYGYFGPVPGLARVPLLYLFPAMDGLWGRLSRVIATLISFSLAYAVMGHIFQASGVGRSMSSVVGATLFASAAITATTSIFLLSPAFIFHEAIAWGAVFTTAGLYQLSRHLQGRGMAALYWASSFAFLAVQTRANIGFGLLAAIFAMSFLMLAGQVLEGSGVSGRATKNLQKAFRIDPANRPELLWTHYGSVMAICLIIAVSPFAVALWKWGSLSLLPLDIHQQLINDPARSNRTMGSFVQLSNMIYLGRHYFTLFSMKSAAVFPYFDMGPWDWDPERFDGTGFDGGEPFLSIPVALPLFVLLSMSGMIAMIRLEWARHLRLPVLGGMCGGLSILFVAGVSHRYLHDLWPFLIITGGAGVAVLWQLKGRPRVVAGGLMAVLIVYGCYVSFGVAALHGFIGIDFFHAVNTLRLKLDGEPNQGIAIAVTDNKWLNGISRISPHNQILLKRNSGFLAGAELTFSASGKRKVIYYKKTVINAQHAYIVVVNGALDPASDGYPNPIQYHTLDGIIGHLPDWQKSKWQPLEP
jgi:hypothetical protein